MYCGNMLEFPNTCTCKKIFSGNRYTPYYRGGGGGCYVLSVLSVPLENCPLLIKI